MARVRESEVGSAKCEVYGIRVNVDYALRTDNFALTYSGWNVNGQSA